ncbi:uncharacterized protein [Bemisia tabaci]|uniref:uncharacterized protein n=1 Tax=Bemisia tabaci TaxID=7038 RepID=UPI003B27DA6B
MFGTDGLGPDLIISDVPRKQMLSAWKTINHQGSFINLNEETMLHNAPLPMGSFNRDVGYFTFNLSQLERLPEERKVELHALVNEKLSSGHLVHIPHQSVDVNDLSQLSRVDVIREHGKKLILDVGKKYRARQPEKLTQEELNKFNVHGEWIANGDSARTFIVLGESFQMTGSDGRDTDIHMRFVIFPLQIQ